MGKSQRNVDLADKGTDALGPLNRFSYEAMATTFEIFIQHDDARYAAQAARAAFDEVDRLETLLSRFIENSDISRINNLSAGESLPVSLDTFECLKIAAKIYDETDGAFDVTIGSLLRLWHNNDKKTPSKEALKHAMEKTGMDLVKLDDDKYTVTMSRDGVQLDLGAIGKGYAVDVACELLRDWQLDRSLVSGGYSTVAALDAPVNKQLEKRCWPLTFSHPLNRKRIIARPCLQNRALSCSGIEKASHIIDPRTAEPAHGTIAAWSTAPDAATADALSTALMVMKAEQIQKYCAEHPHVMAMVMLPKSNGENAENQLLKFGKWPNIMNS